MTWERGWWKFASRSFQGWDWIQYGLFTTDISHNYPVNFNDSVDFPLERERERGKEKEALWWKIHGQNRWKKEWKGFFKKQKKGTIDEHTCNITEKMIEDWLFLPFFFLKKGKVASFPLSIGKSVCNYDQIFIDSRVVLVSYPDPIV